MIATFAGKRVTHATVDVPAWGRWFADVSIDEEADLSGRVEIVVADLSLSGTILSGGPYQGRSRFRLVAGAGGWGKILKPKSYESDAGVKVSTVLGDAATEAGETLEPIAPTRKVGPAFARPSDQPASAVLEQLVPAGWYVDEAGVTRLGQRAPSTPAGGFTRMDRNVATGALELASDVIAWIRPGLVIDGMKVVDVRHELSPDGGLRSTVWGTLGGATSRRLLAWRRLFEQLDPRRRFRGVTEYRVVSQAGKRVNLVPVRVASEMPPLRRVLAMPGVAGCEVQLAPGARVLVAFADSDPSRPHVTSFEDADGEGFLPLGITIAKGVQPAARMGDAVVAGPFAGTVTSGSALVKVG